MPKKPFFSKFYMPGIMTILAFIISIPLAIVSNVLFDSTWPGFILFVLMAAAGEYWQYKRRKPYKEAGEILPSHPFAVASMILIFVAVVSFAGSIWGLISVFEPGDMFFDGWTWIALNGFVWDTVSFSVVAAILSILALFRVLKDKAYSRWLAILSLILALFVMWLGFVFTTPIMDGFNEALIESNRELRIE